MWSLSTATLEIPFGLVYTVFPITATLMIFRTITQMYEDAQSVGHVKPKSLGGI